MDENVSPQNEINENGIQVLMDMGFSQERAEEAMLKTGNGSVELAAAYLLNCDSASDQSGSSEDDWEEFEQNFKMVFVVNLDLKMSIGKTAAQVAHGCLGLYRQIEHGTSLESIEGLKTWIEEGQKKIVLSGKNTETLLQLQEKAKDMNVPSHLVRDAGHTEVEAGSKTVLALFGLEQDVNKITGSLRLLK